MCDNLQLILRNGSVFRMSDAAVKKLLSAKALRSISFALSSDILIALIEWAVGECERNGLDRDTDILMMFVSERFHVFQANQLDCQDEVEMVHGHFGAEFESLIWMILEKNSIEKCAEMRECAEIQKQVPEFEPLTLEKNSIEPEKLEVNTEDDCTKIQKQVQEYERLTLNVLPKSTHEEHGALFYLRVSEPFVLKGIRFVKQEEATNFKLYRDGDLIRWSFHDDGFCLFDNAQYPDEDGNIIFDVRHRDREAIETFNYVDPVNGPMFLNEKTCVSDIYFAEC